MFQSCRFVLFSSVALCLITVSRVTPVVTTSLSDGELGFVAQNVSSPIIAADMRPRATGQTQDQQVVAQPNLVVRPQRGVAEFAFSPDGTVLAVGAASKSTTTLWRTSTGQLISELTTEHDSFLDNIVSRLHFSPDGRYLETGSSGKKIRLWDVKTRQLKETLIGSGDFLSVSFSPDSRTIATTSTKDLAIALWDVASGQMAKTLVLPKRPVCDICLSSSGAGHLAFSPDGHTLATSVDQRVYLWDISTEKIRAELIGHRGTIYDVAFSPDGKTLATISRDATARLWDPATGQLKAMLEGHTLRMRRMAFSPDGRILATGNEDETAKLWNANTGKLIATLAGHKDTVWSISFSPDSRLIATASGKTVKLWITQTGELKQTFDSMRQPLAFSPNGGKLATASKDGTVVLWDVGAVK